MNAIRDSDALMDYSTMDGVSMLSNILNAVAALGVVVVVLDCRPLLWIHREIGGHQLVYASRNHVQTLVHLNVIARITLMRIPAHHYDVREPTLTHVTMTAIQRCESFMHVSDPGGIALNRISWVTAILIALPDYASTTSVSHP